MTHVRYVQGAKLLITKAFLYGRKNEGMCDEFTTVADLPQLLQSTNQTGPMPAYAFKITTMVITFVGNNNASYIEGDAHYSQRFLAGDPTGCVQVHFPAEIPAPNDIQGYTYIASDIAVVVSGSNIHLEVIEATRLIPCGSGHDAWVRRENNISRNRICRIQNG